MDLFKADDSIGYGKLGRYADQLFLLILHITSDGVEDSTQFVFFEKYLRRNVAAFNFNPVLYSIYVDKTRVQMLNKPQKYGAYWEPSGGVRLIPEIEDIQNVDDTRKEIYLMPLWLQYYNAPQYQFVNDYPLEEKRLNVH
jgi:hypothetical protein